MILENNYMLSFGDCLELMEGIPNNSIDMVLTDPPYSSGGLFAGQRKCSTSKKYCNIRYNGSARFQDFSGDNMDQRSFTEFMRLVFMKARLKMKLGGIVAAFTDWRQLPALTDVLQAVGIIWRGIVVWDKGAARNFPGRFRQDCEFVVWGSNEAMPVNYTLGSKAFPGCYHINSVPSNKKHHQTEKPLGLIEKLVAICPEEGVVLDCFMGSGTTGVACRKMNRRFIGIEQNFEYFETARERIENFEKE